MIKQYISMESEEICGYFVTEQQKKIWNIEINILVEFMRVCNKNNLKFFVAHGTLLGAVRHKGFIPWDDDIDVNMPRKDFDKLVKISKKEFEQPFFFQVVSNDKNSFSGTGKLRISSATGMDFQDIGINTNNGLFIDVFPMDGIIENEKKRKKQSKKVENYRGLLSAKIYGEKLDYYHEYEKKQWEKLIKKAKLFPKKYLIYKFNKWCKKYSKSETEREGIISFITDYTCCYWYKKDYEDLILLDFETIKVPAPKNYQRCLSIKWGDYMKMPDDNVKGKKHCDVIMDPDVPYAEYNIDKFMLEKIDFSKKIVIYGAGKLAEEFFMKYHDKIKIEGVYDSNIDKLGEDFFKMKIKNGKQLGISANKDVNIIIASMAFRDIEDSLRGKGFEKIYIYLPGRKYKL